MFCSPQSGFQTDNGVDGGKKANFLAIPLKVQFYSWRKEQVGSHEHRFVSKLNILMFIYRNVDEPSNLNAKCFRFDIAAAAVAGGG